MLHCVWADLVDIQNFLVSLNKSTSLATRVCLIVVMYVYFFEALTEEAEKKETQEMESLRAKEQQILKEMEKKMQEEREDKMEYWVRPKNCS